MCWNFYFSFFLRYAINFLFRAFQLMLMSTTIKLNNTQCWLAWALKDHGRTIRHGVFAVSRIYLFFSICEVKQIFPCQNNMRKTFHNLVATSWPFRRLLLKRASPVLASQLSTDQTGRACVQPTFHGLHKAQLCKRKSNWFCVEIKNYGILPRLATFGLSLQMFMTFHSMGNIAYFMINITLEEQINIQMP